MTGMPGDGDGFVLCGLGHRHWGKFGAAGLLVHHNGLVLLQHRSKLSIGGNTWGVFGGARDSGEDTVTAALRETGEESTLDTSLVRVRGVLHEDHGGWAYDTVIGDLAELPEVAPKSWETKGARWVPVDDVDDMDLFPPFAASWPRGRAALRRTILVIDTANVMGSRNDGWWRDRRGAAERLRDQVDRLDGMALAPFDVAYPERLMIVEGKARGVEDGTNVRVIDSPGEGDDTIVETVAEQIAPDADVYVVTADRELRRRCTDEGATALGPKWLLNQL
jgi:8-oxo-dGTP diphosphatase